MLYLRLAGMSGFLPRFHATLKKVLRLLIILPQRTGTCRRPRLQQTQNITTRRHSWLLKYPEHAITGLLPAALAKPVKHRTTPVLPCVCLLKTSSAIAARNRPAL